MADTVITLASNIASPTGAELIPVALSGDATAYHIGLGATIAQAGSSRLSAAPSATDTTVTVHGLPVGMVANTFWIVIDPYTVQCEVRKVTSVSTLTLTVAALSYDHALSDSVLFLDSPIINVKWFGAVGDDSTDDAAAIQAALDINLSGSTNRATAYYFPSGVYRVNSPLDLTNRRDFRIFGDTWSNTTIKGYISGAAVVELLGARFFVIENIAVEGDSGTTPDVAFFQGRTTAGPNCGNCNYNNVSVKGTFGVAAWYFIASEVNMMRGIRTEAYTAPYTYYVESTNDQSVTETYESLSAVTGSTVQVLSDFWLPNTNANSTGIHFGDETHSSAIRDGYLTSYGTGYGIEIVAGCNVLNITGVSMEGNGTIFMHMGASADVKYLNLSHSGGKQVLLDMASGASMSLSRLAYCAVNGGAGTNVLTLDIVSDCTIIGVWTNATNTYTLNGSFSRNIVHLPQSITATPALGGGGNSNIFYLYGTSATRAITTQSGSSMTLDMQGQPIKNPDSGTTLQRPGSPTTAQQYFDTGLGIPVWWDGSNWVDAAGNTV